jgi:hypothetical protein
MAESSKTRHGSHLRWSSIPQHLVLVAPRLADQLPIDRDLVSGHLGSLETAFEGAPNN